MTDELDALLARIADVNGTQYHGEVWLAARHSAAHDCLRMLPDVAKRLREAEARVAALEGALIDVTPSHRVLEMTDQECNAALAEAMGWAPCPGIIEMWKEDGNIQRGPQSPPRYCSDDSPRSLLAGVEARIAEMGRLTKYWMWIVNHYVDLRVEDAHSQALTAPTAIRARAALKVLRP